jgi:hypothetical protein
MDRNNPPVTINAAETRHLSTVHWIPIYPTVTIGMTSMNLDPNPILPHKPIEE